MAEKNTISILESIKKKIQKFDQPRKPETTAFKEVGDEFDYISTKTADAKEAKINDEAKSVEATKEVVPAKLQSADHAELDQELEDSFSDFLSKSATSEVIHEEAKKSPEAKPAQPVKQEQPEEAADDFQDFLQEDSKHHETATDENADRKIEAETLFTQKEIAAKSAAEPLAHDDLHDDFDFLEDHEDEKHEDDALRETLPQASQSNDGAALEGQNDSHLDHDIATENNSNRNSEISHEKNEDDAFLKELKSKEERALRDAAFGITKDFAQKIQNPVPQMTQTFETSQKIAPSAPLLPPTSENSDFIDDQSEDFLNDHAEERTAAVEENSKYSQQPSVSNNFDRQNLAYYHDKKPQIMDAVDSMLKQKTVTQASDSIKKLLDAKNTVSTVASFAKSDNFNEMALQLMEPKLEKWLNENLPSLVEKIVREEINKIIPKE